MYRKRYFDRAAQAGDADIVIYHSANWYWVRDANDGTPVERYDSYANALTRAIALLEDGTGRILDDTFSSAPYPVVNTYFEGVMYDENLLNKNPLKFQPFDVISVMDGGAGVEWTMVGATTGGDDAVNYKTGEQSIYFNTNTVGERGIDLALAGATDFSGCFFFLRWYQPTADNDFNIYVVFGNDAAYANSYSINVPINTQSKTGVTSRIGWNQALLDRHGFVGGGVGPDWATITHVRIKTSAQPAGPIAVTFDELSAWKPANSKGVVVITFDQMSGVDMWKDVLHKMDRYGWHGTLFADFGSGLFNATVMDNLQHCLAHGWDIASHTYAHDFPPQQTQNEYLSDVIKGIRYLKQNGLGCNSKLFAYPYGEFNYDIQSWMSRYFDISRSTFNRPCEWGCTPMLHQLYSYSMDSIAEATAEGYVDDCDDVDHLLIMHWHSVRDGVTWTPAAWDTFMDYIATKDVQVLSFSELIARYGHTL